jgi:hypothetical protein
VSLYFVIYMSQRLVPRADGTDISELYVVCLVSMGCMSNLCCYFLENITNFYICLYEKEGILDTMDQN